MRILFDNGTPRGVAAALSKHTVEEARSRGWETLGNGELLDAAEAGGFEVFVTTDRNIYQYLRLTPLVGVASLAEEQYLVGNTCRAYTVGMQVRVTPEMATKLNELAAATGRAPEQLVEDALTGYLEELAALKATLDSRYDELKSGRVAPIDGDEAARRLREKSERRRAGG